MDTLFRVVECVPKILGDLLVLQVRFAVKVLGLNVAYALIFRALNADHVGGEEAVLLNFNEIADFDVTPTNFFKGVGSTIKAEAERVVFDCVLIVAAVIFVGILAHRCEDNEDEGSHHSRLTI